MTLAERTAPHVSLRGAIRADTEAVATLWQRGWADAHLGHVPTALVRHRRLVDFRQRVPERLDTTTVATIDAVVVGFVTTHGDEIEQLYVDTPARGTGVAALLLGHGESVVKTRFDRAWLAVVAGNTRARRFYERHGWSDQGEFEYRAQAGGAATIPVPSCRYEKHLVPPAASAAPPTDDHTHREEGGRGR